MEKAWIKSVRFDTPALNKSSASVLVKVDLEGQSDGEYEVRCNLSYEEQKFSEVKSASINFSTDVINRLATDKNSKLLEFVIEIKDPAIWWPHGYAIRSIELCFHCNR